MGKDRFPTSRRSVIKTIGASGAFVGIAPTIASASNGAKFTGLAYDPVTHEVLGDASAQFNDVHEDLRGNLRVAGKRVNMNKAEKLDEGGHEEFVQTKYGFEETRENEPSHRSVRVTAVDDSLTGYVQESGTKVAYSLLSNDRRDESLEPLLKQSRLTTGE